MFILILLVVFLVIAAFSVDIAYIQLAQTELQSATDAAAKAAARELAYTGGQVGKARKAGIQIASLNNVAGRSVVLGNKDFEFGDASRASDGSVTFQRNMSHPSTVRVRSQIPDMKLFFGGILGVDKFSPRATATAIHAEHEIVLAIDRSHSMAFDMSGGDWVYPAGIPVGDVDQDGTLDFSDDALLSPPSASGSRWGSLIQGVERFLMTLEVTSSPPKLGLVTWASYLGDGDYEYQLTGTYFQPSTVETKVGEPYDAVRAVVDMLGKKMMLGRTNTAAGIDEAIALFQFKNRLTRRSIILLTDGQENSGRGSAEAAKDAASKGIVIHVITFLDGDQLAMTTAAEITGGRHIHASNEAELVAAFEELARLAPVSLIE